MRSKRIRINLIPALLAVFSITLLGGCTHADPAVWETFVEDLLRNAAAAFLL